MTDSKSISTRISKRRTQRPQEGYGLCAAIVALALAAASPVRAQGDMSAASLLAADSPLAELLLSEDWTREEMALRLLRAVEVASFEPDACIPGKEMFGDMPAGQDALTIALLIDGNPGGGILRQVAAAGLTINFERVSAGRYRLSYPSPSPPATPIVTATPHSFLALSTHVLQVAVNATTTAMDIITWTAPDGLTDSNELVVHIVP